MYVCILQRKQQVFYFLYFTWHLHWTRPCHWFLIWELNTNPQLSILANVISCWINKQCFCWGEGVNHRSCLLQLIETRLRVCSTERKSVFQIYEQKLSIEFHRLGDTDRLLHADIYICICTYVCAYKCKTGKVEYNFCSCRRL